MPRLTENLFNKGSVYQIDANFGATAGIAEMLIQSHGGEIHLLPALPKAWPTGSVKGLCARGGFEVDIEWKSGQVVQATIHANQDGTVDIHSQDEPSEVISLKKGQTKIWTGS